MKIAVGCDHAGFPLKGCVVEELRGLNHEVEDVGTYDTQPVDYPDYALKVGLAVASGSELSLAVDARAALEAEGVPARVVSMPCWEFFDKQPAAYRESVLPGAVRARLAIEAGSTLGWWRYVGDRGGVVGIDRFGASAPGEKVLSELGFTVENVVAKAKALLS